MTAPVVQALLKDGALAGEWALDPRKSSIRLMSKSIGLIPVNGVFREVSGHGTVSPDSRLQRLPHGSRGVHRHEEHPARYAPALG